MVRSRTCELILKDDPARDRSRQEPAGRVALRGAARVQLDRRTDAERRVVIAIEIPSGAAVAGHFAVEQAVLDRSYRPRARRRLAPCGPSRPLIAVFPILNGIELDRRSIPSADAKFFAKTACWHRHLICLAAGGRNSPVPPPMKLPFRILVLDDDEHALSGLVELLREAEYQVTSAATYDAAKRLLDAGRPTICSSPTSVCVASTA